MKKERICQILHFLAGHEKKCRICQILHFLSGHEKKCRICQILHFLIGHRKNAEFDKFCIFFLDKLKKLRICQILHFLTGNWKNTEFIKFFILWLVIEKRKNLSNSAFFSWSWKELQNLQNSAFFIWSWKKCWICQILHFLIGRGKQCRTCQILHLSLVTEIPAFSKAKRANRSNIQENLYCTQWVTVCYQLQELTTCLFATRLWANLAPNQNKGMTLSRSSNQLIFAAYSSHS